MLLSEESLRYDMLRTAWHDAFVTIMIVLLFDVLPVAIANVFSVDNAKTQIALDKHEGGSRGTRGILSQMIENSLLRRRVSCAAWHL